MTILPGVVFSTATASTTLNLPRAQAYWDTVGIDFEPKNQGTSPNLGTSQTATTAQITLWVNMLSFIFAGGRGMWFIRDNLRQYNQAVLDNYYPQPIAMGMRFALDIDADPNGNTWTSLGGPNYIKYVPGMRLIEGSNEVKNFNTENATYTNAAGTQFPAVNSVVAIQQDLWNIIHNSYGIPICALFSLGNTGPAYSTCTMPEVQAAINMGTTVLSLTTNGLGNGLSILHVYCDGGYLMTDASWNRQGSVVPYNNCITGGLTGAAKTIYASEYGYAHGSTGGYQTGNPGTCSTISRYAPQDFDWNFSKNPQWFGGCFYALVDYNNPVADPYDPFWGIFDYKGNPYCSAFTWMAYAMLTGDPGDPSVVNSRKRTFVPGTNPVTGVTGLPTTGFFFATQQSDHTGVQGYGDVDVRIDPAISYYHGGVDNSGSYGTNTATVTLNSTYASVKVYDIPAWSDQWTSTFSQSTFTNTTQWYPLASSTPAPIATYTNVSSVLVPYHVNQLLVKIVATGTGTGTSTGTATPTPDGVIITPPSTNTILTSQGNSYSLQTSSLYGYRVYVNSVLDTNTYNVAIMEVANGTIAQEANNAGSITWWGQATPGNTWVQLAGDPLASSTVTITQTSTITVSQTNTATITQTSTATVTSTNTATQSGTHTCLVQSINEMLYFTPNAPPSTIGTYTFAGTSTFY